MQQLNLNVPKPCRQPWEMMEDIQGGRLCSTCNHVVVDFSKLTDAELTLFFNKIHNRKVCGRFRSDQLNNFDESSNRRRSLTNILFSLVFILLTANRADASLLAKVNHQVLVKRSTPEDKIPNILPEQQIDTPVRIKGVVLDKADSFPLPGVWVGRKNGLKLAQTDTEGRFEFTLPKKQANLALVFRYIGYAEQFKLISQEGRGEVLIKMEMSPIILGEVCIIKPSLLSRLWTKIKNSIF